MAEASVSAEAGLGFLEAILIVSLRIGNASLDIPLVSMTLN